MCSLGKEGEESLKAHKPSWEAWERGCARFILTYQLGEPGKASRKVMFKKAFWTMGRVVAKPFRKE